MKHLRTGGSDLELFSFHGDVTLNVADFETVYKLCPNLKQLAIPIEDEVPFFAEMGYENLRRFIESVRQLKQLRLLHIRLPVIRMVGGLMHNNREKCDQELLSMQMQKFANVVFAGLYSDPDPKLDALVIGHLGPKNRTDDEDDRHFLPQFYSIKEEQRGIMRRMATVAVSVTRAMLRRTHPYTSILDMEPGVDAWEQWVGQAM